MRRGYKKLLIFEIIIFSVFFINSFVSNILGTYKTFVLLVALVGLFKLIFGLEKDRHRYTKDIVLEVIIFMTIFFILFYLLGIFITYAKVANYFTSYGIKTFILPLIIITVVKEYLRYQMVSKCDDNLLMLCVTCLLFILIDISDSIYYADLKSSYGVFIFLALTLFPAISTNIACTYITRKSGYKPIILYLLIIGLYQYVLPIIPNPDKYLTSVIRLILPVMLVFKIRKFFKLEADEEVERDYNKSNHLLLAIPVAFIIIIVYFTSGYFKYHAIAIASGSMEPKIYKGDVVVIKKIENNYDKLEVGQVIAYKYEGIMVVHRLVKIENVNGKYYFYTKGDANVNEDNYAIHEDMVYGTINYRIPFIGIPTVWLNEL